MERNLSYNKIDEYLSFLAAKHVDVKGYVEDSTTAIAEAMNSIEGIPSPFVSFTNYEWKLSGSDQRTFNTRTIHFAVTFTGIDAFDFKAQRNAKTNAEQIGLDILSRINVDSKSPVRKWLYNNFIKESVVCHEIELENVEGAFGMGFVFDLKTYEPLVVFPDKWDDGSLYCEPRI